MLLWIGVVPWAKFKGDKYCFLSSFLRSPACDFLLPYPGSQHAVAICHCILILRSTERLRLKAATTQSPLKVVISGILEVVGALSR